MYVADDFLNVVKIFRVSAVASWRCLSQHFVEHLAPFFGAAAAQ